MLRNLKAEMVREKVSVKDLARLINRSERGARDKILENYQFDVSEAFAIRDNFFPELKLEYLFQSDQDGENPPA